MIALFESRLKIVIILFILVFVLISFRLVFVSIKMKDVVSPFQSTITSIQRGEILDRDGNLLASNFLVYTVFIDPYVIKDVSYVSSKLAPYSMYDEKTLNKKINDLKNKRYLVIAEKIDKETLNKILSLKLNGVYYRLDILREYPLSNIASNLIGFVDKYNRGLEGIEFYYDNFLSKGENYALKLTIDSFIQYTLNKEIEKKAEEENPDWAIGIISNAKNGEILAVANWPNFSPSLYRTYSAEERKNRAILDIFEPGSTFKVFIAAALLNENKTSFSDYFDCFGQYNLTENITIKDTAIHGHVNLNDIIRVSCNTGIIEASLKMDFKILYKYLRNFNFGAKTGLDYSAEPEGLLKPINKWTKMTKAIINIGQEISVSALQIINAFNSVLNGGFLYEPRLVVEKINKNSLNEIQKSKLIRKTINEKTSIIVKKMLVDALKGEDATGKYAFTDIAIVGGKTGTAQVAYNNGKGYDPEKTFTSFLGFFEYNDEIYTVFIGFMNPKKNKFGGTVAAPVFKNIVESIIPYLKLKNKTALKIDENQIKETEEKNLYEKSEERIINKDVIPDFTGLNLKESIYLASKLGIKVRFKGSGFVYKQSLLPGTPITKDIVLYLELKY